mgnify:FL=1
MKYARLLDKLSSIFFLFLWVPITCIMVGRIGEMFGEPGLRFAAQVNRLLPGLLSTSPEGGSVLSTVATALTITLAILAIALLFGATMLAGLLNQRLRRRGLPAQASIISIEGTGTTINNKPVVRFMLEVKPKDGSPFFAEAEQLVRRAELAGYKAGDTVSVFYSPETLEVALAHKR